MDKESFWNLLDIISRHLPSTGEERSKPGSVPNGPITHTARLSMALRIAAGGDPLDIATNHGVNPNEPMSSFWCVVDAIHQSEQLDIKFPTSHDEQKMLAKEFEAKSSINICNCVGAIDGILIWVHQPTEADCKDLGFGPIKFLCGRKKKFGLNMQACCDARRRFLYVDIRFPGSTSDFFAFEQSSLKKDLEKEGYLHPGLCLFGDAAYVNAPYMCVPYRNVSEETNPLKDGFNFFQSQLRINIECAFGMLVHRFGMLRKPFPVNVSIPKTNSAVLALCKLHNYCIDRNVDDQQIFSAHQRDTSHIMLEGGMVLPRIDTEGDYFWQYNEEDDRLNGLLDGGEHTQDHNESARRRYYRHGVDLPHQQIFAYVRENNLCRPPRRSSS